MGTLRLFDSHTHLNCPVFAEDVEEVWEESRRAGVERAVVVGYDLESSARAVELCQRLDGLIAAVGVSPHDSIQAPGDYLHQLRGLADNAAVVAIGEIGLEYHHPIGHHEIQQSRFREQIALANDLNLPVIIHSRDCDEDLLRILRDSCPGQGVLHCYSGGVETLRMAIPLGLYVSFSGVITFPIARGLEECIRAVPVERLLIETDCPYLAPVPYRGQRCVPSYLIYTAQKASEWKGLDVAALADLTWSNAERLFAMRHCP
jgi:TatD DNase family protein